MTTSTGGELNKVQQKLIPESSGKLARRFLEKEDTPALVVYEAAKKLLGPGLDSWETWTVGAELEKIQPAVSSLTLNKIWCIMALHQNKEVLTDAHVFQKIALTLNNVLPNPQASEHIGAEMLAWAVVSLRVDADHVGYATYFDYGPIDYIAQELYGEGFVAAPRPLGFAQQALTRLNKNPELVAEVETARAARAARDTQAKGGSTASVGTPSGETLSRIVEVQLEKHQRVEDYLTIMHEDLLAGLKHFWPAGAVSLK